MNKLINWRITLESQIYPTTNRRGPAFSSFWMSFIGLSVYEHLGVR